VTGRVTATERIARLPPAPVEVARRERRGPAGDQGDGQVVVVVELPSEGGRLTAQTTGAVVVAPRQCDHARRGQEA
jgi:hypothetical protein